MPHDVPHLRAVLRRADNGRHALSLRSRPHHEPRGYSAGRVDLAEPVCVERLDPRERSDVEQERFQVRRTSAFWKFAALLSLAWFLLVIAANVRTRSVGYGFSPTGTLSFDFSANIWHPASEILHGRGIYPAHVGAVVPTTQTVNPPLLAVLTTPLRLLPYPVALGLFDALAFAAFAVSLWIAGVRDWRIYCIACGSAPVVSGILCGQVTGLIALGYALAWRYRSRAYVVGLLIGLLVALKLLAWPLIIWLLLTRRGRSAVVAAVASVAFVLLSWAAIDFQGLTSFPRLLRTSSADWAGASYSIKAAALAVGIPATTSQAIAFLIAGLVAAWAIWAAVRRRDLASYAAAAAAGIYLSPVIHLHYAMWLVVLVALAQPRPNWIWLAVIGLWISGTDPALSTWRLETELGISLALIVFTVMPRPYTAPLSWAWSSRRGVRALRSAS